MVPMITAIGHGNIATGAAYDNGFYIIGTFGECLVCVALERHFAATAQTFIGGDHQLGATIVNTVGQSIR